MHSGLIFKVLPLALARLRQFLHSSSSNSCGVFFFRFTALLGFSLGITAAVSTAGSGSTAALGAMNDDEGGIVNAASFTAGSGSSAALRTPVAHRESTRGNAVPRACKR